MKYNLEELNKLKEDGWLESQVHPTLPLSIWNYSRNTQFEKNWNDITLNMRGTVLDSEGNLVARGFPKFFNYEEHKTEEIPWNDEYVYIQDKEDGSLGIVFYYAGEWHIATRGSFTSEQAIRGKEILKKYKTWRFSKGFTYLVEIIYPENRIVLDYGFEEKLIFLSIIVSGKELNWNTARSFFHSAEISELDIVGTDYYHMSKLNVAELKERNLNNQEGYVLRFYPSNFRMKIKFEDYVRLHKLRSNLNDKFVWECLSTNTPIPLDNIPDEWDLWLKQKIREFKYNHYSIRNYVSKLFDYKMYGKYNDKEPITNKKEFAEWVFTQEKQYQSILFKMFDGKPYDDIIWKMMKPKSTNLVGLAEE